MTSIIVCVPNVLPPKPVVVEWKGVPCDPCGAGFVPGEVVGVDGVPVVDPCGVLPRRIPVLDVPKKVDPLDTDVVVGLVIAAAVGADGAVVGATGAGATPSSCCRICISGESVPPDVVVGGGADVVVVVVVPHSVDVDGVDVDGVVEPSLELPYTPLDVRSEKLDVVVGGGAVTTVVVVPHPGSLPDAAGSSPVEPGTTPT
jgi:hypothetical protein